MLLALLVLASPSLQEYRYFRALSIDLNGRIPTPDELAAFESDGFDVAAYVESKLTQSAYADRLTRVYMDAMRLQTGSSVQYVQSQNIVRRQQVAVDFGGPGPQIVDVYFRQGQRREDVLIDGTFCFKQSETNQQYASIRAAIPPTTGASGDLTAGVTAITPALLADRTVTVKPWWLYDDYAAPSPSHMYTLADGAGKGFVLNHSMLGEGASVYVCKEEAATADTGHVYLRADNSLGGKLPSGRLDAVPSNSSYAKAHAGAEIDCHSAAGVQNAIDCGCGAGLQSCMPVDGPGFDGSPFFLPRYTQLGPDLYFDERTQTGDLQPSPGTNVSQADVARAMWGEEARRFLNDMFASDRDFRQVLTAKYTYVNGPLTQFYRHFAGQTCCNDSFATTFNYAAPKPLFAVSALPQVSPQAFNAWQRVDDRGPLASGLLTMPVFLMKYGSRRARAHVLYTTFACKDFIAENLQLAPSTNPNLMTREGCSACHLKLEPLAAYFTRITESGWTYLPPENFPALNTSKKCAVADVTKMDYSCTFTYDKSFTSAAGSMLKGAYGSPTNADLGPAGIAAELTSSPDFAGCVVDRVSNDFLGEPLGTQDVALKTALHDAFVSSGYSIRALVRMLLTSDRYKKGNNLSSAVWRQQ